MNSTVEAGKAWFSTGHWEKEPKQKVSTHREMLQQLSRAAKSCTNNKQEQVYLFITDMNPELEELSLSLTE